MIALVTTEKAADMGKGGRHVSQRSRARVYLETTCSSPWADASTAA